MALRGFSFIAQLLFWGPNFPEFNNSLGSQCRCLDPNSSCWPSVDDFSFLDSQLSQPLIYPVPPESACYPSSDPSGNCTEAILHAHDGNWRADQPGSMQATNFQTFDFGNDSIAACYLNTTLDMPCEQGSVPPIGVDARTAEDISRSLIFADKWNLRVVVKNTGHDFLGRSSGRNSFMIWTHNMKDISYNETFVPAGGPSNETYNALTLGAGVQWHEAYDAAESHGRYVVGGVSRGGSVGAAGGWISGGGHSALSPRYGLGVDNVLQFTLVTSSGSHLTVNAYSHPDLFWALRGGGGGTYGIITTVTYNTHPSTPLTAVILQVDAFATPTIAQSVVSEFLHFHPTLADLSWGGYAYFTSQGFLFAGIALNTSLADANTTIEPLFDFINNATAGEVVMNIIPFDSFYTLLKQVIDTSSKVDTVGRNLEIASRLIPREMLETDYERVAETLLSLDVVISYHLVAGGAVSKVDPDSTGLNPAWRTALAHIAVGTRWSEGTNASAIHQAQENVTEYLAVLEELVGPEGGAYFNEASLYEKNPQETFFGKHYAKLKAIKDQYDPAGLFVVAEGVGSERWDKDLICTKV